MILDAVLLAKIASSEETKLGVAIFSEMRITQDNCWGRCADVSQYEIWLTGNIDYSVTQYADEKDKKG